MKFTTLAAGLMASLFLGLSLNAQNVAIGAPPAGSTLTPRQSFTIEVEKPNSLSGSTDVAIVIALRPCSSNPSCDRVDVSQDIGSVLFSGPYTPVTQNDPGQGFKPPYENYTVAVPSGFVVGQAVLSVTHFVLIGAGPMPDLDIQNVTVNIG